MKLGLMILMLVLSATLQTTEPPTTVITAQNIAQLQPDVAFEFADLPTEITIDSGWFTLSPNGQYAALVRREGGLLIYDLHTGETDTFTLRSEGGDPATVLDARFDQTSAQVAAIHTDGIDFFASVHSVFADTITLDYPEDRGLPVRVWFDADAPYLWFESMPIEPDDPFEVIRLPLPEAEDQTLIAIPNTAEQETTAFVRIGRIPAPYAITSTPEGLVRLWDLQTGEVISEVELPTVPVFGRINENTGMQLTWRDPLSESLQLLDFATGENREIATIGGDYIQALMLTSAADVILAVHIGEEAIVRAWISESGEVIDLGPYRMCNRVPDMVQLSQDGTTLVIGCDLGLEVWRIGDPNAQNE